MTRKVVFGRDRVTVTIIDGTRIVCTVLALSTYRRLFG